MFLLLRATKVQTELACKGRHRLVENQTFNPCSHCSGQQTEVQIELACNREADESAAITFVSQVQETYLFRLETPISCVPQPVDCVVQDRQGRQYDLTPLAKLKGNYDVQDSRTSHSDLHYLINVCRPINELAGSTCPGQCIISESSALICACVCVCVCVCVKSTTLTAASGSTKTVSWF